MSTIKENLPKIKQLRAQKMRWKEIALWFESKGVFFNPSSFQSAYSRAKNK